MLRSLTNLEWLKAKDPETRLDILLGTRECLATLERPKENRIVWEKRWSVPDGLRQGHIVGPEDSWLKNISRDVDQLIGASAPEIRVVLPDPVFKHVRMNIDELPKKSEEIERLIRWRLKEEFYINAEEMLLEYQVSAPDKSYVSVFSIDLSVIEQIESCFRENNLFIASYSPKSIYFFEKNGLKDMSGNFVFLVEDYVTYGIHSESKISLYESEFVEFSADDARHELLKRARREFVSSALTNNDGRKDIVLMVGDKAGKVFEDTFQDYKINFLDENIRVDVSI